MAPPRRATRGDGRSSVGGALRIVSGALGGRRFGRPADATRPTSDRVREAIASIVAARIELTGSQVIELFAGTGAMSFELLSRGAERAVLVESDARASADIRASADALGLSSRVELVRGDVTSSRVAERLPPGPFAVALADPPYALAPEGLAALERLAASGRLAPGGLALLEHRSADARAIDLALEGVSSRSRLVVVSRYRYGDTSVVLLSVPPTETAEHAESDPREGVPPGG